MEDHLTVGIETGDNGIGVVQIEFKANAAGFILGCSVSIAIRAVGEVQQVKHLQEILVGAHFHVPIANLFAVNLTKGIYFIQGPNKAQLDIGRNRWIECDFQKHLFV